MSKSTGPVPSPAGEGPCPELLPPSLSAPLAPLKAATAAAAAFPLGGVGTGNVSLDARGALVDWEIWGRPGKGNRLPYTAAALWCRAEGGAPSAHVLEARPRPPYTGGHGLAPERLAGLPRLAGASLRGEYPLARIDFEDPSLPVHVALEAFTPMVPLDPAASGLPLAYLTYRVTNTAPVPVAATVALTMANPVGWAGPETGPDGRGGRTRNARRREAGLDGLVFTGERYGAGELRYGSAVLAVDRAAAGLPEPCAAPPGAAARPGPLDASDAEPVTALTAWRRAGWWDAAQAWWDDFAADGALIDGGAPPDPSADGRQDVGSVGLRLRLQPGETRAFPFLLAWHVPNRPATWNQGPAAAEAPRTRTHYATRFADAWAVAAHGAAERPALTARTLRFQRALWGSTLPPQAIDAAASNLAVLRSPTCLWLEGDGRGERPEGGLFLAWEGCSDQAGCCAGDCTHVWNYAQAAAFLFPRMEHGMRATEFGAALHDDGEMAFRVLPVFGERWDHVPAVDGQFGAVLRLYREWRLSGDRALLERHYPAARKALQFAAAYWDRDGDGLPEGEQHNTYDINFYGPNPLGAAFFLAGLRAGERLAEAASDPEFARACRDLAARGAARAEEVLWNGAYYRQNVPDVDAHPYQFGEGCLADQVLGQLLAHVTGLGHVLAPERVRAALRAVVAHNFRADLTGHASCQRTYAVEGEAGLLLCTWPRGGRPRFPFPYADEVWTGIEYQVAAHLIYEGLVDEALRLVAAARARHAGNNRNPWDECECGHHYARTLSSYLLLPALAGLDYDAPAARLTFVPRLARTPLRAFFSVPAAWGVAERTEGAVRLGVAEGALPLRTLGLAAGGVRAVRLGGRDLRGWEVHGEGGTVVQLPAGVEVTPEAALDVVL